MRDAVIIPFMDNKELVVTTDGCTGVGFLEGDYVKAPLELTARLTARVALMELVSLGASPVAFSFNHIADNALFGETLRGFREAFNDFGYPDVPFIASSEKNFEVKQTSVTVSVTGVREKPVKKDMREAAFVVIGEPFVGEDVLRNPDKIAVSEDVFKLMNCKSVFEVVPCGSGGVIAELAGFGVKFAVSDIDLAKSAGPATCVLAAVDPAGIDDLEKSFGPRFHRIVDVTKF